ncbi:MAG: glycine--tRNA ligase, partial [Propionibacteriaceae bacterium]
MASRLENVIALCKRRGFVYPCGEIYGGTRAAWDYGPLGVALKENIKRQWWRAMVQTRDDVVGLDSSVILPRETWVASGHVGVFTDPLVECLSCHKRYRADQLQEEYAGKKGIADPESVPLTDIVCVNCGNKGSW